MAILVTTRGLGRRGGFLSTTGLGRGIFAPEGEGKADSYRFHDKDLYAQAKREDDEILLMCRGLLKLICH